MAEVKISDVIVPEVFAPYVINESIEKSALFQSGIISADSRIALGTRNGGETVNMPFWNDLDGDAEELTDQASLTPAKIDAGQDVAVLQALGKAFQANDLAGALAGDDPVAVIGSRVGAFWTRNMQKRLIASLNGVFAATSMSDNLLDISASETASVIDKVSFADAAFLLGDQFGELSGVAMHSATYAKLYKDDLLDTVKGSEGMPYPTYQGKRVIVDDGLPVSSGKYTTFLFGAGAFGYAEGQPKVPVETDRDSLAGSDVLISRRHFILHPRGVKWTGATISSATADLTAGRPNLTDLATGTNWTRVYDAKKIRIVGFVHKIA